MNTDVCCCTAASVRQCLKNHWCIKTRKSCTSIFFTAIYGPKTQASSLTHGINRKNFLTTNRAVMFLSIWCIIWLWITTCGIHSDSGIWMDATIVLHLPLIEWQICISGTDFQTIQRMLEYHYTINSLRYELIIIIMVIFKCYFSGEHIALSIKKTTTTVLT